MPPSGENLAETDINPMESAEETEKRRNGERDGGRERKKGNKGKKEGRKIGDTSNDLIS